MGHELQYPSNPPPPCVDDESPVHLVQLTNYRVLLYESQMGRDKTSVFDDLSMVLEWGVQQALIVVIVWCPLTFGQDLRWRHLAEAFMQNEAESLDSHHYNLTSKSTF